MPDKAHNETNEILSRLESSLNISYKSAKNNISKEVNPLLDEMYLDDKEATQNKRLKHAEKDGNLNKVVEIFVSGIILTNESSINRINKDMNRVYEKNYSWATDYIKRMSGIEIGKDSSPDASAATKRAYNRAENDKYVSDEILNALKDGIKKGESIQKLSNRIKLLIEKNKNRATLIARTETTRHQNIARSDSIDNARELGLIINKEWYATNDNRTRDTHAALHGEIVGPDDVFSNGMEFPGDPAGGPSEVCNCRCIIRPILVGV